MLPKNSLKLMTLFEKIGCIGIQYLELKNINRNSEKEREKQKKKKKKQSTVNIRKYQHLSELTAKYHKISVLTTIMGNISKRKSEYQQF